MSQKVTSLRLVVVVTSHSAFLEVNGQPCIIRAIEGLRVFWPTLPLTIASSNENEPSIRTLMAHRRISHELARCDSNSPTELLKALNQGASHYEAVIFHDASRPLIHPELLLRLMNSLEAGADAVRPSIAFTETLKIVRPDGVIRETLDRTSVRHISTPEVIRTSAIDIDGVVSGWFVPLKNGSRLEQIEGAPEGLRINSESERDLLESFLHWRQLNV